MKENHYGNVNFWIIHETGDTNEKAKKEQKYLPKDNYLLHTTTYLLSLINNNYYYKKASSTL